jgi:GTP-binding protein HflX
VLHVVDVSAPAAPDYVAHVAAVLAEIGAAEIPQILVMNKVDRLPASESAADALAHRLLGGGRHAARAAAVSAMTGVGINSLLRVIDEMLPLDPLVTVALRIPASDGATLALLHEFGRVLSARYDGPLCEVEAEIPESLKRRLKDCLVPAR